jgi:uncharacterized membrane protein
MGSLAKEDNLWDMRDTVLRLQSEGVLDIEDAVVAIRTAEGKVELRQLHDLQMIVSGQWTVLGLLIGTLFLNPLAGAAVGLAGGTVVSALADAGISDRFMKKLTRALAPGTAALFVLTRTPSPEHDKVLEELRAFGGEVIQTSLPPDKAAALKAALSENNTGA